MPKALRFARTDLNVRFGSDDSGTPSFAACFWAWTAYRPAIQPPTTAASRETTEVSQICTGPLSTIRVFIKRSFQPARLRSPAWCLAKIVFLDSEVLRFFCDLEPNDLGVLPTKVRKTPRDYHKPDIHNEIRLFAAPKIRPPSGLQFWGLDSDRVLELSAREIVFPCRLYAAKTRPIRLR